MSGMATVILDSGEAVYVQVQLLVQHLARQHTFLAGQGCSVCLEQVPG